MQLSSDRHLAKNLMTASVAGLISTVPFTVVMKSLHKYLVFHNPWSPPPKKIALRVARRLGISVPIYKHKKRKTLIDISHYGYGAATGALYGAWSNKVPIHPIYKGMLHGFLVWAGGYLGWLPATGLWNTKRERSGRRITMITSHVVWGTSLGFIHSQLYKKIRSV